MGLLDGYDATLTRHQSAKNLRVVVVHKVGAWVSKISVTGSILRWR